MLLDLIGMAIQHKFISQQHHETSGKNILEVLTEEEKEDNRHGNERK